MAKHSRKERMALLLQEIVDNHIAPEKQDHPDLVEARDYLREYWTSRDATRGQAWNQTPAWVRQWETKELRERK